MLYSILKLRKRYKIYRLKLVLKKLDPIVSKTFKTSEELNLYTAQNLDAYNLASETFQEIQKLKWEIMTPEQRQKEKEITHKMKLKREGKLW